ncbi:MAG: class I adenylate-forming enzyme family protein [Defluviimonas denitrificans]
MHDPDQYARLSDILVRRMQATPQNPAVQDRRTALDYQELVGKAAALAREMVAGQVHIGDRVFLLIGNSASFAVAFWAIQMAGAVAVPLPVDTPADRLEWMIGDSEPALILAEPGVTVSVAPLWTVEIEQLGDATPPSTYVAPEDLALMIYTSGSTGTPKGVMLSQRAVVTAACSVASYLGYRADDRIFCAIPFTFDYGMHQLTMAAFRARRFMPNATSHGPSSACTPSPEAAPPSCLSCRRWARFWCRSASALTLVGFAS